MGKGKKVDLSAFLAGTKTEIDMLPKGPSGAPPVDRRARFEDREGGGGRGEGGSFRERGERRDRFNDDEPAMSAAESDDQWRKRAPPPARGGFERGGFERGGRDDDEGGFERLGPADTEDQWRSSRPPRGGEREPPPPSAADSDDQWRRAPIRTSREEPPARTPAADGDSDWRRSDSRVIPAAAAAPPVAAADGESDWRKNSAPIRAAPPAAADVSQSDSASDWRRTDKISQNVAPAASSASTNVGAANTETDWRNKSNPPAIVGAGSSSNSNTDDDGRPRLNLKKPTPKTPAASTPASVENPAGEEPSKSAEGKAAEPAATSATETNAPRSPTMPKQSPAPIGSPHGGDRAASGKPSDKWDSIFSKKKQVAEQESAPQAPRRMFGDSARDKERENQFRAPPVRDGSAAFGGGRLAPGAGATGVGAPVGGPNAFNKSSNPPAPRVLPGSDRRRPMDDEERSARDQDRERASMAFGGGRQRRQDDERDYERAASAFGGGNRGGSRFDNDERSNRSPTSGRENGAYEGGLERLRSQQQQVSGQEQTRGAPGSKVPENIVEIAKKAAGKSGNWADAESEEDEKETGKVKQETKLTEEEVLMKTQDILKQYMLAENKKDAVVEVKKVAPRASEEFPSQFVRRCIAATYKDGGVKECKLVTGLILALVKEEVVKPSQLSAGIDSAAEQLHEDEKQPIANITQIVKLLREQTDLKLAQATLELTGNLDQPKSTSAAGVPGDEDEKLISTMLASGSKGGDLVRLAGEKASNPLFAVAYLRALFQKNPQMVKTDEKCVWLDTKEGCGALLSKALYDEEPSKTKADAQLRALFEVQAAFHAVGFPRSTDKKQAIIERAFMDFYNKDIVPPEAIINWKDDLSETPGKTDAIVQLSQFVNWLEEDDDEEDDDEEE